MSTTVSNHEDDHRPIHAFRHRPAVALVSILTLLTISVFASTTRDARADAPFGVGRANVTTDGFTHQWLGGYTTNAGTAWCIESGRGFPRATGNTPTGDLPAARGVPRADRNALAYAIWAYTKTTDPVTGAALATVVHGLSGDDHASVNVPSMNVSDPAISQRAVQIYHEAKQRAFWISDPAVNPWKITTSFTHVTANHWDAVTTVTTAAGRNIVGHEVTLTPFNVAPGTGTPRTTETDAAGQIHTSWVQDDPSQPIGLNVTTTAPMTYTVWAGPNYPLGTIPQQVITPNGTTYRADAQDRAPTGRVQLQKTTDNPAYQSATGATFSVHEPNGERSFGTLTIGSDGTSNLVDVPIGDYEVIEMSAPAGVTVDPTPHPITVTADSTATLTLVDPVERDAGLQLIKVDAVTGEAVAGAQLLVERDSDRDGTYDELAGTITSDTTPVSMTSLTAGDYRITEVTAPPGYELPAQTVQLVTLEWDQTAVITFADHRTTVLTTQATFTDAPGQDDAEQTGSDVHSSRSIGNAVHDTVSVSGLAENEIASISVIAFGPISPGTPFVCDEAHAIFTDSWSVTGSGTTASASFTPPVAGLYTWVATLEVSGLPTVTGPCGEPSESVLVTPTISTVAQVPAGFTTGPVADEITVVGLAQGTDATIEAQLFGPFASIDDLTAACAVQDLGEPVGMTQEKIRGTGSTISFSSSPITLSADRGAGLYTFMATLNIDGFEAVSHPCGAESETFETVVPPTTTTTTLPLTTTAAPSTTTSVPVTSTPPPTSPSSPPKIATPTGGGGFVEHPSGRLPTTGTATTRLVGTGVAMMLLGTAGMLLVARRRLR